MTSQPLACRMRRMMLIAASWPSKSAAAVTKRILFFALYSVCREALRSVMAAPMRPDLAGERRLLYVYVNVKLVRPYATVYPFARPCIPSDRGAAQPQRVGDHGHRAHSHRRTGEDRREQQPKKGIENARRDRHADGVVDEGEEEVLLHVAHGRAGEADRLDDPQQVAFDERHAAALDRDVGSGTHGDADVGL